MSIINIVYHDENIYSVAQKEQVAVKKPPRYHSRFGQMVRAERKAVLDDHRTMGFAEVPQPCPKHFLRKGCGPHCCVPTTPRHCLLESRKPPVPKRTCACDDPCEQKTCRNFRLENIKRVVSAVPIRPKPRYCDTKTGDFHDLEKSGLVPIYRLQQKFGKCPGYIVKRRQLEAKKEQKAKDEAMEKQTKCRFVTPEEREKILGVRISHLGLFTKKLFTFTFLGFKTKLGGTAEALPRFTLND